MRRLTAVILALVFALPVFAGGESEGVGGVPEIEFLAHFSLSDEEEELITVIEERIGADVEYTEVPNSRQEEIIVTRMAADDLPEVFLIQDVQPYRDGYLGGMFASFTDALDTLGLPNIEAYIDGWDLVDLFREDDGELYRLPSRRASAPEWAIFYRSDWADTTGASYDATLDGFKGFVADLMAAGDDPYGITAYGPNFLYTTFEIAFTGFSAPNWSRPNLRQKDGRWMIVDAQESYRDALTWMSKLNLEGFIDPELHNLNRQTAQQRFVQGEAAVLMGNGSHLNQIEAALLEQDPNAELGILPVHPTGPAAHARFGTPGYLKSWVVTTGPDEVMSASFRFVDAVLSDEVGELIVRPEGWEQGGSEIKTEHDWRFISTRYEPDYERMDPRLAESLRNASENAVLQDPQANEYSTDVSARLKPEIASVILEYQAAFMEGRLDVEDDLIWQDYLDELERAGSDELIADITEYYQ